MKVCILSSVHPCFDVRIFQKQARSLAQTGYQVTLAAVGDVGESVVDGVRILGLPQPVSRWQRPLNWWRVLRIGLRERADIYHFHDPELLAVGAVLKLLSGKPVVYDVHENYPEDILTKEWIPAWLRKPFSALFRVAEETAARWMDGVVVVNECLAERFRGKSRVATVFNYSRLESAAQPQHGANSAEQRPVRYFVYAGRISDDRGLHECAQALARLEDSDVELLCAGRIGHVAEEGFRALLEGQHPQSRFKYLGLLPYEAIPPLLQDALAGLLCFRPTPNNVLGTPNKLFEYMSASIPVIASDFPFIREVVSEAGCGILVRAEDVDEIASAMERILQDPEGADRMGRNGLQAVQNRFNWETEEKKLLALYDGLLGTQAAG
jgi:glycosyltransferase involved in cell wall biosynthesis